MVPGTVNELSAHDRMILDLEKTEHTSVAREALCRHIELPLDKYTEVPRKSWTRVLRHAACVDASFST